MLAGISAANTQNRLNHERTPMIAHIRELRERAVIPYLSLGHKLGAAVDDDLLELLGPDLFASNTWITGDAFHRALHESEVLAADAWGADQSFYLVEGSSGGNHSLMLGSLRPGDKVIISRDIHWSLMVALILTGAQPIYVAPRLDPDFDIGLGVEPGAIAEALHEHPDAKLVVVVSPSFCGIASDLAALAETAHQFGIPLYVDEAWGPHFHFHPRLPASAMASGADAAVSSIHKILPAVSQGSVLHVRGDLLDRERIATAVAMMQTTSPLLPILATMDSARKQMVLGGLNAWERVIDLAERAKREIRAIPGLGVIDATSLALPPERADITKLVVDVHELGITGFEVERRLNDEFAIAIELSDHRGIIANFNLGDSEQSIDRFVSALREIAGTANASSNRSIEHRSSGSAVAVTEVTMTPRDAYFAPTREVQLELAAGETAAELLTPYPPGIPVLAPGDLISQDKIDYLLAAAGEGRGNYGDRGAAPATIKIVDQSSR